MKKETNVAKSTYKWVERNISKIGHSTYRIRVGQYDGYSSTRDGARALRKTFLNKMG